MIKLSLALAGTCLLAATRLAATEYVFSNTNVTLNTPSATPVTSAFNLELGTFAAGFTPTLLNISEWAANWNTGDTGYYDHTGPEWSAGFTAIDNTVFTETAQLYVWAYDFRTGSDGQWALVTDTAWTIIANSSASSTIVAPVLSASSTAVLGSYDFSGGTVTLPTVSLSAVPEPATYAITAGLTGLAVAFYRQRRRPRQSPLVS